MCRMTWPVSPMTWAITASRSHGTRRIDAIVELVSMHYSSDCTVLGLLMPPTSWTHSQLYDKRMRRSLLASAQKTWFWAICVPSMPETCEVGFLVKGLRDYSA